MDAGVKPIKMIERISFHEIKLINPPPATSPIKLCVRETDRDREKERRGLLRGKKTDTHIQTH